MLSLVRTVVLVALPACCQVLPRQTTFSNSSTNPTTTSTAVDSAITGPPPCCWVIGGTFEVGVNRWYSTSIEEVVATVITNFARYNDNTTIALNSTTIYKGANETFAASSFRGYAASELATWPITSPIVVPTDMLTGAGAQLTGIDDYAGTFIDNTTAATWPFTNLAM